MDTQEILLRKVIHGDSSVSYHMVIKQAAILTEIKLKKYQYLQMKSTNLFKCAETDFREGFKVDKEFWNSKADELGKRRPFPEQ